MSFTSGEYLTVSNTSDARGKVTLDSRRDVFDYGTKVHHSLTLLRSIFARYFIRTFGSKGLDSRSLMQQRVAMAVCLET